MKKQLLKLITGTSLCSLFVAPSSSFAQIPSYIPTNGLVGWWPFNGNANDESGNNYNGVFQNNGSNGLTYTQDRNFTLNSAINFQSNPSWNSLGPYVELLNSSNISLTQYTMNLWVKVRFNISTGELINKGPDNIGFLSRIVNPSGGIAFGSLPQYLNYSISIDTTQWKMLTFVRDNLSNGQLFIDGNLIYSTTCSPTNNNAYNFAFGSMPSGGTNGSYYPYQGKMDDIGIWNRALSQQEITDLYNAQTCTNPTASITPQSSTTFCQGGSVVLQATTGATYTYEWYKNGVLINGANQGSYTATTSGNYTVKVIDGTCNATSAATTVTVNPNPSVSINSIGSITNYYAPSVTLSGSPAGGTFSGSGVSGNSFNPQQAGLGTQTISYSYTNASNCSGSASTSTLVYDTLGTVCTSYDTLYTTVTDTLIINTTLSLAPPNDQNTILIYPNPASDHITIDNGNYSAMSGYSLKITNNAGQQVFQNTINQPQFYLDLSTWSGNGLYYVHLIDPQGATVTLRKIVLQ